MPADNLTTETRRVGGVRILSAIGRIDFPNAERFQDELARQVAQCRPGGGVVADLSRLDFVTSAGLRAFMLAQKRLTAAGCGFAVCGVGGVVEEIFEITKFTTLLPIEPDLRAAVARISPDAARELDG